MTYQPRHVHAVTFGRVRLQIPNAAPQDLDDPIVIRVAQVMKSHADLQNSLVKIPNRRVGLGAPHQFQRFVLLPILAAIKLLERVNHLGRRRAVTARARGRVARGECGGNFAIYFGLSIRSQDNSIHSRCGTAMR
jgi:hypothetical protein